MRLAWVLVTVAAALVIPALLIGGFNGLSLIGVILASAAIFAAITGPGSRRA